MYCVGDGLPMSSKLAYYCPHCYDRFENLALVDVPDLFRDDVNENAAAAQLDMLLNLTKKKESRHKLPYGRGPSMVLMFPVALIVDRLPFKRYYLTGDELARHAEEARRVMCVEVPDVG